MSTISASDRAAKTDEIRDTREEYEAREAVATKKQRKELKRANEKHVAEINKLQEQYQGQVEELRDRQKENLSVKDQRFQKEMERVKSMYVEQMKRKSTENDEQRGLLRDAATTELERERKTNASQRDVLSENFKNAMKEHDKDFQEYSDRATTEMKGAITNRGDKIREKFEQEKKSIVEDRDRMAEQQSRDVKNLRTTFKTRVDDLDRKQRSDRLKDESNFRMALKSNEATHSEILSNQRQVLAAERKATQKKFGETLEKKLETMEDAQRTLQDTAMARIDRDVRKAEEARRDSETQRILEGITAKRLQSLSEGHLKDQFEDRLKDVETQKKLQRDIILDIADQRVDDQLRRNDSIVQETNRRHKMDMNIRTQQAKDEFENLQNVSHGEVEHASTQADERVRKIIKTTTQEQIGQQKFHEKHLDVMKNTYVDNLANQRQAQMEQLQKIRSTMEQRLRDNVKRSEDRMEQVTTNYESKIEKMKDDHAAEVQRVKESVDQRLLARDKSAQMDHDAQELKFKTKVAAMEETHQADLDRLQRRHDEQIANMEARIRSINRKA